MEVFPISFDMEYILTPCDHRVHDEILVESTELSDSIVEEAALFGVSVFGDTYGDAIYVLSNDFGTTGTFIHTSDGDIIAIFPLQHTIANSPELFFKTAYDYNRVKPPYTKTSVYASAITYGANITYGQEDFYFGGDGYVPVDVTTEDLGGLFWYPVYTDTQIVVEGTTYDISANSLVISRYNNKYTWLLDYNTVESECPYCKGSGVKNDLVLSNSGRLQLVYNIDKLAQQVIKAIITDKGKNKYYPNYGTIIMSLIGAKNINGFLLRQQIIDQLQSIKRYQAEMLSVSTGLYNSRELLEDLLGIKFNPTADPRVLSMTVTILNSALERADSKVFRFA